MRVGIVELNMKKGDLAKAAVWKRLTGGIATMAPAARPRWSGWARC